MPDDTDFWTIEAMREYGGSFVKALAELASRADNWNLGRIKVCFKTYWKEYEKHGAKMKAERQRLGIY